ncbi:hypothetical protein B0T11DRAFT_55685 [Plectosphaerella cucumerina]|uniref:Uncharacterized protein n=1 Tax=Plectosphaerella cucumerina TaxID=40658 RepID=A0A8K0TLX8_9PEZI|nr:hypothetical protein B0T11DRAFT_55685 [Plectosphaerella cucumerina]
MILRVGFAPRRLLDFVCPWNRHGGPSAPASPGFGTARDGTIRQSNGALDEACAVVGPRGHLVGRTWPIDHAIAREFLASTRSAHCARFPSLHVRGSGVWGDEEIRGRGEGTWSPGPSSANSSRPRAGQRHRWGLQGANCSVGSPPGPPVSVLFGLSDHGIMILRGRSGLRDLALISAAALLPSLTLSKVDAKCPVVACM